MNTQTLDTRRAETTAASASGSARAQTTVASTRDAHPPSPLDRLAMRVGLALVLWSRRERRVRHDRDAQWQLAAYRNGLEREREARERLWLTGVDELSRR
jgi:hypothetical protein